MPNVLPCFIFLIILFQVLAVLLLAGVAAGRRKVTKDAYIRSSNFDSSLLGYKYE